MNERDEQEWPDASAFPPPVVFDASPVSDAELSGEEDTCPKSPTGLHEPDPMTLAASEDHAQQGEMVIDVICLHCGRSGSTAITVDEINW